MSVRLASYGKRIGRAVKKSSGACLELSVGLRSVLVLLRRLCSMSRCRKSGLQRCNAGEDAQNQDGRRLDAMGRRRARGDEGTSEAHTPPLPVAPAVRGGWGGGGAVSLAHPHPLRPRKGPKLLLGVALCPFQDRFAAIPRGGISRVFHAWTVEAWGRQISTMALPKMEDGSRHVQDDQKHELELDWLTRYFRTGLASALALLPLLPSTAANGLSFAW